MSCYLCSNETLSVVADVVAENFNVTPAEAFDELLSYNYENLEKHYHNSWPEEDREYVEVSVSEAQKVQSVNNYLYQTTDHVDNFLLHCLEKLSKSHQYLVDESDERLYWDIADRICEDEPDDKELYNKFNGDVVEIAKQIRKDLKAKYGKSIKFSVTTERGLAPCINIRIKEISDEYCYTLEEYKRIYIHDDDIIDKEFKLERFRTHKVVRSEVIKEIQDIHRKYNYNHSDPLNDYYDVGYYGEHVDCFIKRSD